MAIQKTSHAVADNDVYEHYLPWIEAVVRDGLKPNALWYHWFTSKGAYPIIWPFVKAFGPFGVAWMSVICAVGMALVIWDLTPKDTRGWAVSFFFLTYDAVFLKWHPLIGVILCFLVWCIIRKKAIWISGPVALYLGFFQPILAPLFVLILAPSIRLVAAMVCGVLIALAVNYAVTGIPELYPINVMWKLVNHETFFSVFGDGVRNNLDYIRGMHSESRDFYWGQWEGFRINFLWPLIVYAGVQKWIGQTK